MARASWSSGGHALAVRGQGGYRIRRELDPPRCRCGPFIPGAKVQSTGPRHLTLARDVTQGPGRWKKDDWIAVATTSFSPFETEFVQLASAPQLNDDKPEPRWTLSQPLKHYHFGGPTPAPLRRQLQRGQVEADYNYGVDERAEVGLITRSIKLTAVVDSRTPLGRGDQDSERIHQAVLQGVEIEKFGKARLGAYPIHLHQLGAWQPTR